ncbi:MAG TPA: FAD-dependent oxidoreductase, partial [Longimicrobium sp.]|nr:FAD-dependent oxidoreductase [Longimicrobium sp.]
GWTVRTTSLDDGRTETHDFDWLVVCNGVFSEPFVPDLPGREEFEAAGGRVLHSTQLRDEAEAAGQRVVVIGYAKSACDAAAAAAPVAESVTLAYRRALWKMPKRFLGFVHLKYVLTTRFSESLFRYRTPRGFERVAHTAGRPFVWLFWRGIERVLRVTHGLDAAGLVPDERIETLVGCGLSLANGGIYEHIRAGRVRPVKGEPARLHAGEVELASGDRVAADLVIFGTGFRQSVPFLAEEARARIVDVEGVFHLYRNLLHPDVPRLGFVGYNSSLYSQLTSEIGARWLARHVMGRLRLPGREAMLAEFAERWAWMRAERGASGVASGTCIVPFNFHYLNDLLTDLGARTWRGRNRLKEFLMPVDPALYADLKAELDARHRLPPREPSRHRDAVPSGS